MSSLELKVPPPAIAAARRRGHVGAFAFHFTDANADGDAPMDGAGHCAGGRGILHRRRRLVPSCGDDAQSLGAEIDHFIGEFRRLLGHPESHVRGFAVRACRLGDLSCPRPGRYSARWHTFSTSGVSRLLPRSARSANCSVAYTPRTSRGFAGGSGRYPGRRRGKRAPDVARSKS